MSASVRPATSMPRRSGSRDAVHDAQRLVDRVAVRVGGAQQQRPVDVEEQEHAGGPAGPRSGYPRANDVSALSDCANAAISRAHACTSSSWTISTEECM